MTLAPKTVAFNSLTQARTSRAVIRVFGILANQLVTTKQMNSTDMQQLENRKCCNAKVRALQRTLPAIVP